MLPIMLRSFGRSGSTLMMQVLGSHPNVIFDRTYPFENRHLTYIHRLSSVIKKDHEFSELWTPDSLFDANNAFVGPIPYKEFDIFDKKHLSNTALKYLWAAFSESLLEKSEIIDESLPVYYAEKVVQDICPDINSIIEAKNLFIFRDPRDEFLSIKSFNEKRGFHGFGWLDTDTDESFAARMAESRKHYMRNLAKMKNDERRLVVLYEDFMANPYNGTKLISEWIGLPLSYDKVIENLGNVGQHITSKNINGSTLRWKTELSPSVLSVFDSIIGDELVLLGY